MSIFALQTLKMSGLKLLTYRSLVDPLQDNGPVSLDSYLRIAFAKVSGLG